MRGEKNWFSWPWHSSCTYMSPWKSMNRCYTTWKDTPIYELSSINQITLTIGIWNFYELLTTDIIFYSVAKPCFIDLQKTVYNTWKDTPILAQKPLQHHNAPIISFSYRSHEQDGILLLQIGGESLQMKSPRILSESQISCHQSNNYNYIFVLFFFPKSGAKIYDCNKILKFTDIKV